MCKENVVIVFTGREDPMWPFLLEACSEQERKKIRLFETDQPRNCSIEYDPVYQTGLLKMNGEFIDTDQVNSVWYRRFVPPNLSHFDSALREYCEREYADFFQGIEFAFAHACWVSTPSAIESARSKPRQLRLAQELGFRIPKTTFTNSPEALAAFAASEQVIYKSIRSPRVPLRSDRHTSVFTTLLNEDLLKQKDGIMSCPGIVQQLVKKKADIRISVFGQETFAVRIDSQSSERSKIDFRNGARHLDHEIHFLPPETERKCIQLVQKLGLLYGAIDLALMEDDSYVFFEINPNGQWGWLEMQVGLPMRRALLNLLFKNEISTF